MVGGDLWIKWRLNVTAAANIAAKTFVTAAGAVPASAAGGTFGVANADTPSGDTVNVKTGVVEVIATGTVTAGGKVEILQGTVYGNINGVSTAITAAGVQDVASGYPVGLALTGTTTVGDTVLVETFSNTGATKVS